jgi:dimethyladenosine transferase
MLQNVRAKKYLGQHFLKNEEIAHSIVLALSEENHNILEVGAGMGVLTKYLLDRQEADFKIVEIDSESVAYLKENYPVLQNKIFEHDFLRMDLQSVFSSTFAIIGNFPYNISSQILFKVLENRDSVLMLVGMFQKEVAERICANEGSKVYGLLTVLLKAYYDMEYLFTVEKENFFPQPKVQSAVIRMTRNAVKSLPCDEKLFTRIVKAAFAQRRKMLHSALKCLPFSLENIDKNLLMQRAEQLNVDQFVYITNNIIPKTQTK